MKIKLTLSIVLIGCISATAIAADHKAVVVHRQGIYKVMAGHMDALKSILILKHPKLIDVQYHADSILNAAKHHGNAFPKGSGKGKTQALPTIWEKPKDFKSAGIKLRNALNDFTQLTDKSDMKVLQAAFKKVGSACKSCHDDFRKKID